MKCQLEEDVPKHCRLLSLRFFQSNTVFLRLDHESDDAVLNRWAERHHVNQTNLHFHANLQSHSYIGTAYSFSTIRFIFAGRWCFRFPTKARAVPAISQSLNSSMKSQHCNLHSTLCQPFLILCFFRGFTSPRANSSVRYCKLKPAHYLGSPKSVNFVGPKRYENFPI